MCEINESNIELKFHDICRLCASYENKKISLFSDEAKRRRLKEKIQNCFPFKVEEHDAFPKFLCLICVENLENTYEFRHKCIQVNRNLEKYLKKEKEKQEKFNCQPRRIRPEVSIFALPLTGQTSSNQNANDSSSLPTDSEDAPNPLDYLEVGVNAEESNLNPRVNEIKKQYLWNANKRWLSSEFKPINLEQSDDTGSNYVECVPSSSFADESNMNRRKNTNPRKIARDIEDGSNENQTSISNSHPAPGLIAISIAPPYSSNSTAYALSTLRDSDKNTSAAGGLKTASTSHVSSGNNQTFSCLLCDSSFNQRTALNKHFSSIHGIEPFDVLNQTSLLAHSSFIDDSIIDDELAESMVEQETIIFCEVCRREFQDRASLWLHMVHAHREEASLSCGICLKIFTDSITLIEHVNTAHSGDQAVVQRRYSCQVCGRQHDSRQKLLKHATLHTLIDNQGQTIQPEEMISLNNAFVPRECPVCHKKFFSQEKLDYHIKNLHSDSQESTGNSQSVVFKCELCVSTHASRIDRWWHMYHSHSGDERVTCTIGPCKKVFVTQALKDEHCKSHHESQGQFTNTCEVCGKLWESRTVFYKHMMNVHPKCLPSVCGVCMKIFSNVAELRQHVKDEHATVIEECNGICCDVCGRSYAEKSKMLRHRRVHNVTDDVLLTPSMLKKKDDLQCNACPELVFETLEEIADHRKSVHQLFVCDLCPKFYNGNNHLWKHVSKQHRGDPSVTCNICLKTSASRAHLYRHKLKYHSDPIERLMNKNNVDTSINPPVHKCTLCSREFRIRSLLNKHAKNCKGVRPSAPKFLSINGMFPCSKCNKVFEQQGLLSKHMKNSHVVHFCEGCPDSEPKQEFDNKSSLLQHIREQHKDDPEFFCDVEDCDKVLRVKADLQKHKLEHSRGYFTYICDYCGDMFSNRKKLRKHLLTFHKATVQHLCAVCVAILPTVDELAKHVQSTHPMLMHRPFTCQICGKCWSVSSKAVDHVTKAHGTQYRPCKICWKVFIDEKELEEHTENHPPIEEKPILTVKKDPSRPTSLSNKYNLPKELSALGVDSKLEMTAEKRLAEDDLEYEESGKRMRKKYKCLSCRDTFRSILELNEHKVEKHNGQDNVEYCEDDTIASSTSIASIKEEEEIDPKNDRWTDSKPIACDCCSKVWNSKKQLWQHLIRSHISESMHTCGICLKVCHNYFDLFYHLDKLHLNALNDPAAKFACPVCGHYHNSQSKLEKHVTMHKFVPEHKESHRCLYCHKVYRSVVFFREHERTHESKLDGDQKFKLKNEQTEFSGFSISSILEEKVTKADDNVYGNGNEIEEEHEDDIELETQDDEDMVELEENDDSGSENSDMKDDEEEEEFRGYENELTQSSEEKPRRLTFKNIPQRRKIEEEELEEENEDADLESNISCSTINSEDEEGEEEEEDAEQGGIPNGKPGFSVMNNNQKQKIQVKPVQKLKIRSSNGENFYSVTDDV